jgi:hypothetical protein
MFLQLGNPAAHVSLHEAGRTRRPPLHGRLFLRDVRPALRGFDGVEGGNGKTATPPSFQAEILISGGSSRPLAWMYRGSVRCAPIGNEVANIAFHGRRKLMAA